MYSRLRQRGFLLVVSAIMGLLVSLCLNFNPINLVNATTISERVGISEQYVQQLESQGQYFYSLKQFQQAIDLWQQALQIHQRSQDSWSQARILSKIALAEDRLNNSAQSSQSIAASLELLETNLGNVNSDYLRTLAQVYNNQGILYLNQGQTELAITTWEQAKVNYAELGNDVGVIRASVNQATAFKQLGLYRRALKTLTAVNKRLEQQPDSLLKVTALRSYGDILRLVGQAEQSKTILNQSWQLSRAINAPEEQIKTLLALGNSYKSYDSHLALQTYQRGLNLCRQLENCEDTDLSLQLNLAQINVLSATKLWRRNQKLIPSVKAKFELLTPNRTNIERKIYFARTLLQLKQQSQLKNLAIKDIPSWSEIESFLDIALEEARTLEYPQAQSYILGLKGQIKEENRDWSNAQADTQKALLIAQNLNAPEIVYLWQWQLGRIKQAMGERQNAIAHYSRAVELLKSISQDLVAIDPNIQYSFSNSVEPVYRGLVSLLLETEPRLEVSQANLEGAREVIESLQLAELNNFFREACLDARVVDIDRLDRHAAVIYPIILSDRLEVILSLPNQPLKHYTANISQPKLEKIIARFRHNIVVRSRRNFYSPAKQLYKLLIAPALKDLTQNQIKTLVFVPDGALRNIPLGALHNGQKFLIEDYSIALTPGLQLLNPQPLQQTQLKTIAAGLTKRRAGFSALTHVNSELKEIKNKVSSVTLLNKEFTTKALQEEIKFSNHPIVHIATHGQFGSSLEDTFLLAWDERININELDNILKTRNPQQKNAIELLVLSACETASGDKWAALGMAGMAVRAGAKSTLATLWSVNDRATSAMMSNFYHELADKKLPKAEAVRQAQLNLLQDSWHRHPFYWAPYVLLGNWL